ncbi:MAG: ATP-binding protein [Acidaminobacteraceae bacterium]
MSNYILSHQDTKLIDLTLSSIADITYQGIVLLNSSGKTIYFNRSYCDFVEKPRHELIGSCPDFLIDNFNNPSSKMMTELNSYNSWISEYSFKNKSGHSIHLSSRIVPLIESEKMLGYICYFSDITEKINIEKKLIENNRALVDSINELKDAQSNMIQHEKLAGIGHLSAGIAHELNNPLGFVKSNIDILTNYVDVFVKLQNLYEEVCECFVTTNFNDKILLEKIANVSKFKENNKVDYLINDINDLVEESAIGIDRASKIVDALRQFSTKNDNVSNYIYNVNDGIETTLLISKNHWRYDAEISKNFDSISNITANGNELNQVFLNLITNSVYAIKEKRKMDPSFKGIINIATSMDNSNIYIDFKDNGSGIDAELIPQIFNPFFTTKPVGKGTGLGLNISYNIIVNKHKGTITVNSDKSFGTQFKISLPISPKGGSNETITD